MSARKSIKADPAVRGYHTICGGLQFDALFLFRQHLLDFKSGHATASSTCDRLSVPLILHVTGSEYSPDTRLRRSRDSQDVSVGIDLELVAHDCGGGFVTNSVEETGDGKVFLLTVQHVLDAEVVEKVAVTLTFNRDGVPKDGLREKKSYEKSVIVGRFGDESEVWRVRLTIFGLFMRRLAMILEALSSPLLTRT